MNRTDPITTREEAALGRVAIAGLGTADRRHSADDARMAFSSGNVVLQTVPAVENSATSLLRLHREAMAGMRITVTRTREPGR